MKSQWTLLFSLSALLLSNAVAGEARKKSIALEIHDTSKAELVRSIPATNFVYGDVRAKVGRVRPTEAVVIRCNGYGYGVMANDLFYSGGRQNESLSVAPSVPLRILCEQMEAALKKR